MTPKSKYPGRSGSSSGWIWTTRPALASGRIGVAPVFEAAISEVAEPEQLAISVRPRPHREPRILEIGGIWWPVGYKCVDIILVQNYV